MNQTLNTVLVFVVCYTLLVVFFGAVGAFIYGSGIIARDSSCNTRIVADYIFPARPFACLLTITVKD